MFLICVWCCSQATTPHLLFIAAVVATLFLSLLVISFRASVPVVLCRRCCRLNLAFVAINSCSPEFSLVGAVCSRFLFPLFRAGPVRRTCCYSSTHYWRRCFVVGSMCRRTTLIPRRSLAPLLCFVFVPALLEQRYTPLVYFSLNFRILD